ncbi:helix-turn-helix transcriptional regulator [Lachnospiraceae bacterium KK002]
MNKYKLGEFIRYYRKKQKVSQADLCRNLCSVATMSRIENGETDTPVMMAQTLLERLGLNVNKFELLLDRDDSRYFRRRDEVDEALWKRDIPLAEKELAAYEAMVEEDKLHQQYIKLQKAKILLLKAENAEPSPEPVEKENLYNRAEQLLAEAAEYTIPKSSSEGEELLLSKIEIEILLTKVRKYQKENLLRVHNYMKKHYSMELMEEIYPMVQLELAKILIEEKKYQEALREIEDGLEVTGNGRSYCYCADLHFLYAQVLPKLNAEMEEQIQEECVSQCLQAYYLYDFDEDKRAGEVVKYLREVLQWECIEQEM